eukprot:jgi/Chlat1/139/Chrsp1S03234
MDFSETLRQTGCCAWSPTGAHVAASIDNRVFVRDSLTLQVVHIFSCLDRVEQIEWSTDSTMLLCCLYKRSTLQAFSIEQPDWYCKIDEGPAGVAAARWAPCGRQLLSTAQFNIRITAWSLHSKSCVYIPAPKHATKGLAFSSDGRFMALAERKDCKDYVSIFVCEGWDVITSFPVETTDLADLAWSPDGSSIAVWDSCLDYQLCVYSADGRLITKYEAYKDALGIRSMAWSPSGSFIAIGSYDQKVRILNYLTWSCFAELEHPSAVKGIHDVVVYREVEEACGTSPQTVLDDQFALPATKSRYDVAQHPALIPNLRPAPDKPNPKMGVAQVAWSPDNEFLVTRNANMPTAVWIWDMQRMVLSTVLLQIDPVKAAVWDPQQTRLAVCTGTSRFFIWSPQGASCYQIPVADFRALGLQWHPSGTGLLLTDKDRFCCSLLADGSQSDSDED